MNQYSSLLSPFRIRNLNIKNRLCVSAMGIRSFESKGSINHEGIHYYTEFARGGFGLITTGALATDNEIDENTAFDRLLPMAHRRNFIFSCSELTERIHSYGTKIFAQLSMGVGRNGSFKSASPNPSFFSPDHMTGELSKDEIRRKIELMSESAKRCQLAGFDGIEVHAMHWGYLLDQFAMSITNRRRDEYGGALENRMQIMQEILDAIKNTCGRDYPVTMRLGLKSYITGPGLGHASLTGENEIGRTLQEGLRICQLLESHGYDALSCDVGVYESFYHACPPMYIPKGNYLPLAGAAKKQVSIPVLLGGRMNDFQLAEEAVRSGRIDAVCLARPALADPSIPQKLALGIPEKIRPCLACCQCIGSELNLGGFCGCTVNPSITRNISYGLKPALIPKKITVIGGGISGMAAALTASQCGHEVTLLEASSRLGGHLLAAGCHPFKEDIRSLNTWFQNELRDRNIDIRLNTKATLKILRGLKTQVVLLATGSDAVTPKIQGMDHPKCISCIDALLGNTHIGDHVVIVGGGMTGAEMALTYAMDGKFVTLIEAQNDILSSGPPVPLMQSMMLRDLLSYYSVLIHTNYRITEVNDKGAVITSTEDDCALLNIPADTVITAIGFCPKPIPFEDDLYDCKIKIYTIGDANRVGNIRTAIWDAYEIAREL